MANSLKSFQRPKLEIIAGNRRNRTPVIEEKIPTDQFVNYISEWLGDGKLAGHSKVTSKDRTNSMGLLSRFLANEKFEEVGRSELKAFFHHLATGHEKPGGRWGNGSKLDTKPLAKSYRAQHYERIKTFYSWLIAQEIIDACPMVRSWAPNVNSDQIAPFQEDHLKRILEHTKHTRHALRNEAIYYTLLGTGIRASEFCNLRMEHVDLSARTIYIENGKGGKDRTVGIGRVTTLALRRYLRESDVVNASTGKRLRMPDMPVFMNERQGATGRYLTAVGLSNMVSRWGIAAGVTGVRCSPHTFRHTFAVMFLKNGGSVRALQNILGHEHLRMTMRYVKYSEADQINQHHAFDVVDRLGF